MPKIILINGPCGIGKSTISKLLHERLALSYLFERDEMRRKFSQYKLDAEHYAFSGQKINQLLLGMVQTAIQNDIILIIDAILVDEVYIREIERIVETFGGEFLHFCLMAEKSAWKNRIDARGFKKGSGLTPERAEQFYNEIVDISQKIDMIQIDTTEKNEETVIEELTKYIFTA